MSDPELATVYEERFRGCLVILAERLEKHVKASLATYLRVERVTARPKSVSRFVEKAMKTVDGKPKYSDPLNQIQDQIGVRVVTFYLFDVEEISALIEDYYAPIEAQRIVPDSPKEFGYEGKHYVLFIPDDLLTDDLPRELRPRFFELQIKTVFQHAWGEADHDLAYKAPSALNTDQRRRVAFTAAQAWGADRIFDELARELLRIGETAT